MNGSNGYDPRNIDFFGPANIEGGRGSFIGLGTCTGCVTMIGSLSQFTKLPFTLYTASNNGLTSTMLVTSDFIFIPSTIRPELFISGSGTLTLTGFDATPGVFALKNLAPCLNGLIYVQPSVAQAGINRLRMSYRLHAVGFIGLVADLKQRAVAPLRTEC